MHPEKRIRAIRVIKYNIFMDVPNYGIIGHSEADPKVS